MVLESGLCIIQWKFPIHHRLDAVCFECPVYLLKARTRTNVNALQFGIYGRIPRFTHPAL
jgi:hypothetical protein